MRIFSSIQTILPNVSLTVCSRLVTFKSSLVSPNHLFFLLVSPNRLRQETQAMKDTSTRQNTMETKIKTNTRQNQKSKPFEWDPTQSNFVLFVTSPPSMAASFRVRVRVRGFGLEGEDEGYCKG